MAISRLSQSCTVFPPVLNLMDKTLASKLALVLLLKFALLLSLWWGFVREQRLTVDANHVAAQFLLHKEPTPITGVKP
jgi:hypothetical protein